MRSKSNVDLTKGVIWKQLLLFVWPIILASVFEQLYNITNSMIAGNLISTNALSAISATSQITIISHYFLYGISTACGILVSNYYGARDMENVQKAVDTGLAVAIVGGLIFALGGQVLAPFLLKISNINRVLYSDAEKYLRVYMIGSIAVFIYNMSFFVMRSLGDSRHPLYFLMVSCVLNIILGVVLVKVFDLGVIGIALATVISELITDVLALHSLTTLDENLTVNILKLHPDKMMIGKMMALGIPASFQNILIALSEMMIQSHVNLFPNEVIAGIGVANKVAIWVRLPMQSISVILTNYVGQNLGAKEYERVQKGIEICNMIGVAITLVCCIVVFIAAEPFVSMFDKDATVIEVGVAMTRYTIFSSIPLVYSHMYNGACRASGNVRIPMLLSVLSQCICRYLFVYIGMKLTFDIRVIYLSSLFGYTLSGIFATLYFRLSSYTKEAHLRP